MKKKLTHNLGLKLASLVLAFILWFVVVTIEDPTETVYFNNIQVKLINTELLDKENKVFEVLDNTDLVRVTVQAPRSIKEKLRASDIVAEADVSKLTDINTIAISFSVPNAEIDSIEGNHEVVRLNVEDKASKWVKLNHGTTGEVAEGYMVSSASPDQTIIEVTGPKSLIEQVSYAKVEIDVSGATTRLSANVEINLYDKENNMLEQDRITKNVNYAHMTVEILATKEVPIELNVMGVPAEGYMETGVVTSKPANVKIAGTPATLANINKISIPEEELNITGASADMSATINLREYLPENIKLAETDFNGRITAVVSIEPKVAKTLDVASGNITISNLPQGYTAELPGDVETYGLEVEGLGVHINPLYSEGITGSVDIAKWMTDADMTELESGVYTLPVTFNLSDDVIIKNTVNVQVTILKLEETL